MRTTPARRWGFSRSSLTSIAVLAVTAGVACVPTPAPPAGGVSAIEVESALEKFEEAWEREDLEAAVGAFTPDAVAFDPVPPGKFEGVEKIREWISGSFDSLDRITISMSQLRIRTVGPVAWVTAHYVFEARQAGNPIRAEGQISMVWIVQADGSPRLSVFHASHLPEPSLTRVGEGVGR